MTPSEAVAAGAAWIVVGRPITIATDPGTAAAVVAAEIAMDVVPAIAMAIA